MATRKIERPERLGEKLRCIRLKLGLSQSKMAEVLAEYGVKMQRSYVSSFENRYRLPTPLAALAYAKLAKVSLDLLLDDKRDLPKRLLSRT